MDNIVNDIVDENIPDDAFDYNVDPLGLSEALAEFCEQTLQKTKNIIQQKDTNAKNLKELYERCLTGNSLTDPTVVEYILDEINNGRLESIQSTYATNLQFIESFADALVYDAQADERLYLDIAKATLEQLR